MRRDDLYARWADQLRCRYTAPSEPVEEDTGLADPASTPKPETLEQLRILVADRQAEVDVAGHRLRGELLRALDRAEALAQSSAVTEALAACPGLLPAEPVSPARAERILAGASEPGGTLWHRRERMRAALAAAAADGVDESAAVAQLRKDRDNRLAEVEGLRTNLRTRHGLARPDILAGLETVGDDHAFRRLFTALISDARSEADWQLERDVFGVYQARAAERTKP